jgi:type II secretory pathway pseudopilin PulG
MLNKSFTLIETITAIFILTTGILALSSLISYFISASSISSQRLIAAYLAQEGIEIVRNLRDTNLLNGRSWDYGLNSGDWQADYNDATLSPYTGSFLNLEGSGFYGYGSGNLTVFKRKINLQKSGNVLKILVEVSWQERGRSHSLTAQANLYNWQP